MQLPDDVQKVRYSPCLLREVMATQSEQFLEKLAGGGNYSPRVTLQKASEYIDTPGFVILNGKLKYGCLNTGFKSVASIDANDISRHDLLTLKEADPNMYHEVVKHIPEDEWLLNDTRREVINLNTLGYKHAKITHKLLNEYGWSDTDKLMLAIRNRKHSVRNIADVTNRCCLCEDVCREPYVECKSGHTLCTMCSRQQAQASQSSYSVHAFACAECGQKIDKHQFSKVAPEIMEESEITAPASPRSEKLIVRCPECKRGIEKSEGCNKMSCVCSNAFCYACRKDITSDRYAHFCNCQSDTQTYAGKCIECGRCMLFETHNELTNAELEPTLSQYVETALAGNHSYADLLLNVYTNQYHAAPVIATVANIYQQFVLAILQLRSAYIFDVSRSLKPLRKIYHTYITLFRDVFSKNVQSQEYNYTNLPPVIYFVNGDMIKFKIPSSGRKNLTPLATVNQLLAIYVLGLNTTMAYHSQLETLQRNFNIRVDNLQRDVEHGYYELLFIQSDDEYSHLVNTLLRYHVFLDQVGNNNIPTKNNLQEQLTEYLSLLLLSGEKSLPHMNNFIANARDTL